MEPRVDYRELSNHKPRLPLTGHSQWDEEGVAHLKGLIPHALIDAYVAERKKLIGDTDLWRPGWNDANPYQRVPTMLRLATFRPLSEQIKFFMGDHEPGLHLCLTGFQSTERAFHSDSYLNPEYVRDRYIAAWIVLDDVHPDSGPFEYAPGSHRLPILEREKIWSKMKQLGQDPNLPTWPSDSQGWVGASCERELQERGYPIKQFLGKKGDVLLWHAYLIHRGSKPKNKELERRSLIAHYSSIHARPDMQHMRRTEEGSFYFTFGEVTPTR